jgi:endonuclease/exonuclease/phosphatase family metal-dependent hydrolase
LPILEDWLDGKSDAGFRVALLGDFNRGLDRGSDVVREELDDQAPVDLFNVPHHQELTCSAFSASPQVVIDYVIVNEALWESVRVSDTPNIDVPSPQITDHCPVFVDVNVFD